MDAIEDQDLPAAESAADAVTDSPAIKQPTKVTGKTERAVPGGVSGRAPDMPATSSQRVAKTPFDRVIGFQRANATILMEADAAVIRAELTRVEDYLDDWDAYFCQQLIINRTPWLREDEPDRPPANWPHAVPMPRSCEMHPRDQYPQCYEYYDGLKVWREQLQRRLDKIEARVEAKAMPRNLEHLAECVENEASGEDVE